MKIGLIDVDGHNFPNLALMKLSAWHKQQGDTVEWVIPCLEYDRIYMSKVFTDTPDFDTCLKTNEVIKGGTGYDLDNKLPEEVEGIYPDYGLYNIKNVAYGFLTRGCPRDCPYCIVSEKEGLKSRKVADVDQFWRGQKKIVLMDPNLLACRQRLELLDQLVETNAWVDINQGLDIRFMTEEVIDRINRLKVHMLHFAWDREKDSDLIIKKLETFKKATDIDMRKARVYVLTNYETSIDFDLYRVYTLRDMGYDPYIMIYNKRRASKHLRRLARWVNNKFVFRKCERFEDYKTG